MMNYKEEMKKLNKQIELAEKAGELPIDLYKRQIEVLEAAHSEFVERAQNAGYDFSSNLEIMEVEIKQFSAMKQVAKKAGIDTIEYDKRIEDTRKRVVGESDIEITFRVNKK